MTDSDVAYAGRGAGAGVRDSVISRDFSEVLAWATNVVGLSFEDVRVLDACPFDGKMLWDLNIEDLREIGISMEGANAIADAVAARQWGALASALASDDVTRRITVAEVRRWSADEVRRWAVMVKGFTAAEAAVIHYNGVLLATLTSGVISILAISEGAKNSLRDAVFDGCWGAWPAPESMHVKP